MCVVGHQSEQELRAYFQVFGTQWPGWSWLRERLRKADLEPTALRELRTGAARSSWVVLAKPAAALQRHFELAPEVLVLCTPWQEVQANDIARVERILREEVRIDPGFVLVIARDPEARDRLGPAVPENRAYLFVSDETFRTTADLQSWLRELLREALGRRRLFDLRLPAAGPQFFGREKEFEALERDVLQGHCVGVFGLRKVGKTSLLRRVTEKFREADAGARRVLPVEVDLLETPYPRRNLAGVAELIGRQLDREVRRAGLRASPDADPLLRLQETVAQMTDARLLLILDEYEVLLNGRIPRQDGLDLLTWLRGVAQGHPTRFGFVLAGRNQRLLAPARIDGTDNPMYRFLRDMALAGLAPEECRGMVRKIGCRMALRFEPDALELVVQETGGHPALARTLGDLVDQHVPTTERTPASIDGIVVRRVLSRFAREVDEDMRELVNAANDIDPRGGGYLVHLAYDVPWIGGASEARLDDALARYGILHADTHRFRIGRLATWLRENHARPAEAAHA
ncbi:MAG: AAA family ATPase [Deltaproteobacteria bacterium]|nr:AAA family ATPase [Deltaproteobacteria bacterium]